MDKPKDFKLHHDTAIQPRTWKRDAQVLHRAVELVDRSAGEAL